jgi:hypothetical protein
MQHFAGLDRLPPLTGERAPREDDRPQASKRTPLFNVRSECRLYTLRDRARQTAARASRRPARARRMIRSGFLVAHTQSHCHADAPRRHYESDTRGSFAK